MGEPKIDILAHPAEKPDIYTFHDYRSFLREWLPYLKRSQGLSVRQLAKASHVSESYLSMVLSADRTLSETQLEKLLPHLELDVSERSYLTWLREITDASDDTIRLEALKKVQRFRSYRELNPLEIETYNYLTNWHFVAIRELTQLSDFKADAKWIQRRLNTKVSLPQIKKGLDFLLSHKFIELNADGSLKPQSKRIHCKTGVLKPALTQFHRDMLSLACDSIDNTPSEERTISAHTCAIPQDKFDEARRILEEAREKIAELGAGDVKPDVVYHFSFLAFPLTKQLKQLAKDSDTTLGPEKDGDLE